MSWRQFRTDLGALRTAIIDPRTTAKPFVQLWSTFSEGGVLVDTPDPLGRWAVLLHTSILLDGSITTFVQQHWLETADIAELQTHAQTHIAQTSGRIDPFDELRAIARAMWYAASLVSFALASIATARETYRTSPAGSAALICAPILLRALRYCCDGWGPASCFALRGFIGPGSGAAPSRSCRQILRTCAPAARRGTSRVMACKPWASRQCAIRRRQASLPRAPAAVPPSRLRPLPHRAASGLRPGSFDALSRSCC